MIPYIFVFSPQLLLIDTTWQSTLTIIITSMAGMLAVGAGMIGYWLHPLNWLLRLILLAGGVMLVVPEGMTDVIGAVLVIAIFVYQKWFQKETTGRIHPSDRVHESFPQRLN